MLALLALLPTDHAIDIILLHEIVATAEHMLQSLPERERLPSDALFRASDETLPKHGVAPEDVPHISGFLFKIGGRRGPESLLQKFQAVLADMGIEIDYTDDPLAYADSPDPPSLDLSDIENENEDALPTPKASGPINLEAALPPRTSTSLAAQHGSVNSSSPMHYAPHRRRNSDSIAVNFNNDVHEENHRLVSSLARAHSAAGMTPQPSGPQKKEVRFSDVIDSQSISEVTYEQDPSGGLSTIENIPFRQESANDYAHPASDAQPDEDERPSTRAENRAPPDFSNFGQQRIFGLPEHLQGQDLAHLANGDILSDEEFSEIGMEDLMGHRDEQQRREPSLPRHADVHDENPAAQENDNTESTDELQGLRHDEYSTQLPLRNAEEEEEAKTEEKIDKQRYAFLDSRAQMFKMSSFNHWRSIARFHRRAQAHADWRNGWRLIGGALEIWIESALTMHLDENQGQFAYQEHLRHIQAHECGHEASDANAESPNPFASARFEGSVHPHVRQSIERSRLSLSSDHQSGKPGRQQSQAVERTLLDKGFHQPLHERDIVDVRAEQLQLLGREWERERLRQGVEEDELYYEAEEELEEQEMRREVAFASQYQIAAAAWDYFLVSKAFSHWANRAAEEVQRTEVARRHILRRKCFNAWLVEGQNEATEAESKAVWFTQLNVLKQWRDAAVTSARKNDKLRRMAVLREWKDVTEESLVAWYRESKFRLAEAIDTHSLQSSCLQHWSVENRWLSSAHEEAEGIYRGTTLGRYMRFWAAEARIQERAEQGAGPIITRRDEFLRAGLALAWRHEAEEIKAREKVAIRQELGDLAKHWLYETKLIAWQEEQDAELLDRSTYHWYCEWRLVVCRRVMKRHEKARFVEKWADATATQSARTFHLRHLAKDVRYHNSITGFFNASMDALEQLETRASQARGMIVQRAVPKVLKKWTGRLEHHRRMERRSKLGRFWIVTENVVPHWREIRKQEWKKRMTGLYTDYKYRANRGLVRHCLGTWWQATADTVAKGWEADDMIVEDDNALVLSVTEAWRTRAEYVTFSREVAEDADKEVQLTAWHSLLEGQEESMSDAIEYDFVQTTRACSDEWTLTSVALRGQEHAVQEFQGHKQRRDLRHFFATWASRTTTFASFGSSRTLLGGLSDSLVMDHNKNLNSSFRATFRRSSRWASMTPVAPTPRTRNTVDYTPFRTPARKSFRVSTTTPKYRPPSELTFDEVDEEDEEEEAIG